MTGTFKRVYILDDLKKFLLISLIVIQILSIVSNVFIVKYISKTKRNMEFNYRNRRSIILMSNIALSGSLLTLDFLVPIFLINPFLVDRHPLTASIVQSVYYYVNTLTLFLISISMTVLSIDQYFAFTRIFTNPLDDIKTKHIMIFIWISSLLLSVPFAVYNDVFYFGFNDFSIVCFHPNHYFTELNENKAFLYVVFLFMFVVQYCIPALSILALFIMIIIDFIKTHYFKYDSNVKFKMISRMILIFTLFIVSNTTFHINSLRQVYYTSDKIDQVTCPIDTLFIYCFYIFFVTVLLFPVYYFGMRPDFRRLVKNYFNFSKNSEKTVRKRSRPRVYKL